MRVLLIHPPADQVIRESLPIVVEDATGVFPPLGLLYVAAYAEQVAGCELEFLDCRAERIGPDAVGGRIALSRPDVVGIQVMTFTLMDALATARQVRTHAPLARIVLGGPHPTLYPEATLRFPEVDAVVMGEGERPFQAILEAVRDGRPLSGIPGVLSETGEEARPAPLMEHLDDLLFPARHLLKHDLYVNPMAGNRRFTTLMSSRGCPYTCIYCDRPAMERRFRARSAEQVVREMHHCVHELGIDEIKFYDDTFAVDRDRVLDICDRILSERLNVTWEIRTRPDTLDQTLIRRLRQAGCVRFHLGVETGSPRLQKVIAKRLDMNRVESVFRTARAEGVETLGYFMIGLPTETGIEQELTLDLIRRLPMDYLHLAVFTPYPGTAVYQDALRTGVYETDHWREFAQSPRADFTPPFWEKTFTGAELRETMRMAYARFYRRPGYLLRRLFAIRSAREFYRKAALGLRVLKYGAVGENVR